MAFDSLSEKLQDAFKSLKGKGKITEEDVNLALRQVRTALLEADVNFMVAKDFVKSIKEKALGEEVFGSLNPAQTVIKIVNDELTALLGGTQSLQQLLCLLVYKVLVKRLQLVNWLYTFANKVNIQCLLQPTYIVQQRLSNCK